MTRRATESSHATNLPRKNGTKRTIGNQQTKFYQRREDEKQNENEKCDTIYKNQSNILLKRPTQTT